MVQISVSVSTEYGSSFEVSTGVQGLINITARTYILSGYNNPDGSPSVHCYSNDLLNIHGTPADLRLFAERLIDATEEPALESDDLDLDPHAGEDIIRAALRSDAQIDAARECTTINEGTVTEAERFWAWALGNDAAREDSDAVKQGRLTEVPNVE